MLLFNNCVTISSKDPLTFAIFKFNILFLSGMKTEWKEFSHRDRELNQNVGILFQGNGRKSGTRETDVKKGDFNRSGPNPKTRLAAVSVTSL